MQTNTEGGRGPEGEGLIGQEYSRLASVLLLDARLMWQGWLSLALLPWLSVAKCAAPEQTVLRGVQDQGVKRLPATRQARRKGNVLYVDFR